MANENLKGMIRRTEAKEFLIQVKNAVWDVADEWHGKQDTDDLYRLAVGLTEIEKAWW